MGNLSKSGITSAATFNSSYLSNLYDCLTGTKYDNINQHRGTYSMRPSMFDKCVDIVAWN